MHPLSVAVLGPFEAWLGDRALGHFRTKSVQALLVYLLVEGGTPLREWLTELIWPGLPPDAGRKNLRQTLYELRQLVPDVGAQEGSDPVPLVLADRQRIQLNPAAAVDLDLTAFEQQVGQGGPEAWAGAVALYRGDFLSDFYLPDSAEFEEWTANRRAAYRRQALEALARLADFHLKQGEFSSAESYARRQLELDALQEAGVRQLMMALAAQGQRSAALRAFEEARRRLDEALQVEPDQATVILAEEIEADKVPVAAELAPATLAEPAVQVPGAPLHNLVQPATPLVGRRQELDELAALLAADQGGRLITLLGPGGSGKTRLALEAALQALGRAHFLDGVWFVPLAALSEPEAVVVETAEVMGFSFSGEGLKPRQQLLDYLRERRLLLVLDNYEHLLHVDQVPLPADILATAPHVRVLVTSRTRLNVHGEQLFPLGGLTTPGEGEAVDLAKAGEYDAPALFAQAAGRLRPDFAVDKTNLAAVIRICRLVDGLPLALEMAAAWLEVLSPEAIAAEIERGLDILAVEWQDVPARQRSLRAVFESSWQMLAEAEQAWLKRLAVFRGGFERAAAEAVAEVSLRGLLALVHKSWLTRQQGQRYQIHELLRQYAHELLVADSAAWQEARDQHARYFAAQMKGCNEAMRGPDQKAAFDALATDFENIRGAWHWLAVNQEIKPLVEQMAAGLLLFCGARSREGDLADLVQVAWEAAPADAQSKAVLQTATAAVGRGYYAVRYFQAGFVGLVEPEALIEQAWQHLREREVGTLDGLWLVLIATFYGWNCDRQLRVTEAAEVREQLRAWLEDFRRQGDRWAAALAEQNLGRLLSQAVPDDQRHISSQTTIEAQRLLTVAASSFEQLGDKLQQAHSLRALGQHLHYRDSWQAETVLQEARSLFLASGDQQMAAHVLWDLAQRSLWAGEYKQGFARYRQLAETYESWGNRYGLASVLGVESMNAVRYGDLEHARRVRLRSLELKRELGDALLIAWDLWELGDLERIAGDLTAARRHFEAARQLFSDLGNDFGLVFCQRASGDLALDGGDSARALTRFEQALQAAKAVDHEWSIAYLLARRGRAIRLVGDEPAARRSLKEAIRLAQAIGHDDLTAIALVEWAELEAAAQRPEPALALATLVQSVTVTWGETRDRAAELAATTSATLPAEVAAADRHQGQTLSVADAVAWILEQEETKEGT